jgi:peptidoglycan/LPS O-acetylase OafA/YrhL
MGTKCAGPICEVGRILKTQNLADAGRIRELDGWRGVSILLVLFHHALYFAFPMAAGRSTRVHHLIMYSGELGVRIFFVISGFVITRLLILEERKYGSISVRGFYVRRLFRILPVFYCYVLAVSIFSWLGWTPVTRFEQFSAALFFHDWQFYFQDWFLGHSWSLAVEEQFYIVFPLFWLLAPARWRPILLVGTLAAFLAWSVFFQFGIGDQFLSVTAIAGFSCIHVGALLAVFEPRVMKMAARVPGWLGIGILLVLFVHPVPHNRLAESLYGVAAPFALGLTLMCSVAGKGWLSAALTRPAIQGCGLVSYSAYLWQQLFLGAAGSYGNPGAGRAFHFSALLLPVVAGASFYWIEGPCTRFGRRLAMRVSGRSPDKIAQGIAAS